MFNDNHFDTYDSSYNANQMLVSQYCNQLIEPPSNEMQRLDAYNYSSDGKGMRKASIKTPVNPHKIHPEHRKAHSSLADNSKHSSCSTNMKFKEKYLARNQPACKHSNFLFILDSYSTRGKQGIDYLIVFYFLFVD